MNCFKEFVDIKTCGVGGFIKLSNLHIMAERKLQELAKAEGNGSAEDVLNAILYNALMRMEVDITSMVEEYDIRNANNCFGRVSNEIADFTGRQGITVSVKPSTYLQMNFEIAFYSGLDGQNVTFFVEENGIILWSKTVTTVFGENRIPVEESFPADLRRRTFFVGYDQPVKAFKSDPIKCETSCGCDLCCECQNYTIGTMGGLVLNYEAECSLERLICKNYKKFKNAFYYAAGVEFIFSTMGSARINSTTAGKGEKTNMLLSEYENRYVKAMNAAMKSIDFCDDCCFKCKPLLDHRYVCP